MPRNAFGQEIGAPLETWRPPSLPPRSVMAGRTCRLEPLDAARHSVSLFDAYAAAPDARDWTYLPLDRPTDVESFRGLVAAQACSKDPLHFAIVDPATGRALGSVALMRIDAPNGTIEVGHVNFSPSLKRTPVASEAIFLLMSRVFDDLGYRRLEWKCDSLNAPSRRAAERFGFTFEGIFRNAVVTKARNRDTAWYSLIDADWPAVRAAFAAWLDPENFAPDGGQKRRLADLLGEIRGGGV